MDLKCARSACRNFATGYVHRDNGKEYCHPCAVEIERLALPSSRSSRTLFTRVYKHEMIRVTFTCGCYDIWHRAAGSGSDFKRGECVSNCCQSPSCRYDQELSEARAKAQVDEAW